MQYLYKHCPTSYLPKLGRQLRLGTLSGYRQEENRFIRDEHEGRFSLNFIFDGKIDTSIEWLDQVTFGTSFLRMPFGAGVGSHFQDNLIVDFYFGDVGQGIVTSTDDCRILHREAEFIKIDGKIDLVYEQFDAFVFCMSFGTEVGSIIHDPTYDSAWRFPESRKLDFMKHVASLVWERMTSGHKFFKDAHVGPFERLPLDIPPQARLKLASYCKTVSYRSKEVLISKNGDPSRHEVEQALNYSAFTKPTNFSSESEFRFLFRPFVEHEGRNYPIPNQLAPLFIPCDNILELIESV